jgi:RNA polymerase primary sigma factor
MIKQPFKITTRITDKKESSIDAYLNEVAKIPMFTNPQEEYECALLALNGDAKAKQTLITKNLRFVISVAKSYQNGSVMLADLINEGNLGLIQAADKYDPSRGIKFYSYAVFYIRKNILEYISEYSTPIRVPSNKTSLINKVKRYLSDIEQTSHRHMDVMDLILSKDSKFTEEELLSIMPYMITVSDSLDTPIEYSDGIDNKHEFIEENTFGWADTDYIKSETLRVLGNRINKLTPVEKLIITHRYGLKGESVKTLSSCAELPEINMTAERVRQIEKKALSKLKKGEISI